LKTYRIIGFCRRALLGFCLTGALASLVLWKLAPSLLSSKNIDLFHTPWTKWDPGPDLQIYLWSKALVFHYWWYDPSGSTLSYRSDYACELGLLSGACKIFPLHCTTSHTHYCLRCSSPIRYQQWHAGSSIGCVTVTGPDLAKNADTISRS